MATVGGIGVGFVVLAVIWVVSIVLFVALSRTQGSLFWAGVGVIVAALAVSLILWFLPRGNQTSREDNVIYDDYIIRRSVILAVAAFFLLVGLVMYGLEQFDVVRGTPLGKLRSA